MSTRFLKKVLGNDISLLDNLDDSDEEETSNVQHGRGKQKLFNVFDLLNENSENGTDSIEELESSEEEKEGKCDMKFKSKKKYKKQKKVQKQKNNQNVKETSDIQKIENQDNLDEIDRTVLQINKLLGEPMPSTSLNSKDNLYLYPPVIKTKEQVLTVQHKNLNAYNELKRIFGSKTIQAEQHKPRTRGRIGHFKKTWLVTVDEAAIPTSKSLMSMTIDRTMPESNFQYFIYEHSPSYRQVQQKFIDAVESLDPENIINIVNAHSYNVDALLQSAELCKLSEDLAMAAKLIERALFFLEYAFHPLFNITTANCRLDYRKQQNRALFITLFKHLVLVGGRACYRTSLELCKLLLSLDPDGDPLAAVLMIDFYAIRSKEYEWFCEFCDLWENSRNLQQLPNIAYSLALANFYLGKQETADELLQKALIMFPGVLIPLLDKCNVQTDSQLKSHEFFLSNADISTPSALEKLQSLYVSRSFYLWKETEILPWLEKQVHVVLTRVDARDDFVKFSQLKRNKRYQGKLPRNILRHLIVSDLKDVTVNVQEIQIEGAILSHDPLPPENSIDIYSNPRTARRSNHNNSNLLSLFFSSIFNMVVTNDEIINGAVHNQNENHDHQNEYD